MHARTARPLEEIHAIFAQVHDPQVRRERAHVENVRAHVEHVVADARQLGKQHPQILRAFGHFEIEQLLNREHIGMLLTQRRAVIQAVEVRQRLQISLLLDQLFGAAVKQADMRIDALDHFAIQLHHHAQNAVRGRVLGAEIDRVIGDDFTVSSGRFFEFHQSSPSSSAISNATPSLGSSGSSSVSASGCGSGSAAFSSPGRT